MNIYNFNRKMNGINNLNEGDYTNYMLSNIENNIANEMNMDMNINLDGKNPYINKEIKF